LDEVDKWSKVEYGASEFTTQKRYHFDITGLKTGDWKRRDTDEEAIASVNPPLFIGAGMSNKLAAMRLP
jgi:hypothetical protein